MSYITKKSLISAFLFSLIIIIVTFLYRQVNSRTIVVFCDVGQGDATYIRIKNKVDILIDAGPDKKILNCLGHHMPFYDRKIELVIISHEQKDHIGGLKEIKNRYQVEKILSSKSASQGDVLQIYGDKINVFWPPKNINISNVNEQSLIFLFQEKQFKILFTGDIPGSILDKLSVRNIDVLKIPHHGSKNGLSQEFLKLANAGVAVISVGAKNTYGHPAKAVLDALQALKIKIKRTDKDGNIVFRL